MPETHELKGRFKSICDNAIKRDGITQLMDWLDGSDFYTAPASTKYHGAYAGGLLQHKLNVYDELVKLLSSAYTEIKTSEETVAIISLFHDLCKVNYYKPDTRNVKINGVWQAVPCYSIDEKYPFGGHGSKSVFICQNFIQLTPEEAAAINCHMSCWNGDTHVGDTYERFPLAWLLHVADESATFLIESHDLEAGGVKSANHF